MSVKRPVDIIDWRGKRAKKIVREWEKIKYEIFLRGGTGYQLKPYEIIRLVNIIATSNGIKRSLEAFEKVIWRSKNIDEIEEIIRSEKIEKDNKKGPDIIKVLPGKKKD